MTILKKGTCDSSIVVSSSVYTCPECSHTEIKCGQTGEKKCPKCNAVMIIISSHVEESEDPSAIV